MLANGFMADRTHLNLGGSQYLADFAWNDLGFFALGSPSLEFLYCIDEHSRCANGCHRVHVVSCAKSKRFDVSAVAAQAQDLLVHHL